jgi:4-amino-4-deoxy-L-arabinose transferase-like glycosyltransferase
MSIFKKYIWIVLGLGILTLFFFTRFYNILGLPIFTDEAIYIRWAQIAGNDATWRFISLTDGKQPMYVWIAMILMKLIDDPLLAGRLVSVLAGFGTMIGIFFVTSEIFKNRKIGLLASFLYVIYPFSLVYDRMALYDSLVAMFMVWALYFEVLLVRRVRLDLALILGMIIGVGLLTKTHANFAFILLPFSLLLFNWKAKNWKKMLLQWSIFALVAVVLANAMYLILRLSPFFHIIAEKNYVFAYRPEELIKAPFAYFIPNLSPLSDWVIKYMTLPFLTLVGAAFLVGKKYGKEKLFLLLWFVIPIIATAFVGRTLYPRFILFMTLPLLILGTYALYEAIGFTKKVWLKAVIVVVFITMFVINDYFIITDFAKAAVPRSDKGQFLTAWPSGVGVPETVAFLKEKSQNQKIYVGTGGTFGLMPYALEIYFVNNPNVTVRGFWPVNDLPPQEVIDAARKMPTYFVFYQECPSCPEKGIAPAQWKGVPVMQIKKMEKETYYTLYQIPAQ